MVFTRAVVGEGAPSRFSAPLPHARSQISDLDLISISAREVSAGHPSGDVL